jgi:hypothetical protein
LGLRRYRAKDKIAINAVLNLAKIINANEMPLCKTSDSDVSKETIAEWKVEFENNLLNSLLSKVMKSMKQF